MFSERPGHPKMARRSTATSGYFLPLRNLLRAVYQFFFGQSPRIEPAVVSIPPAAHFHLAPVADDVGESVSL